MSARFSEDEMKVIQRIMKLTGFNRSQFVRRAVSMGAMSVIQYYVATSPKSPVVKASRPLLQKIKAAGAINFKEDEAYAKSLQANLSPKRRHQLQEMDELLMTTYKVFIEHNPRGPKPRARRRGRHSPYQEPKNIVSD